LAAAARIACSFWRICMVRLRVSTALPPDASPRLSGRRSPSQQRQLQSRAWAERSQPAA